MNNTLSLKNIVSLDYKIKIDGMSIIKMFLIAGVLSAFLLVIFYVIQYENAMSLGFESRNQENRIAFLEQRNRDLKVTFTNVTSLDNIEKVALDSGFEKVGNVTYVEVLESSFAKIK